MSLSCFRRLRRLRVLRNNKQMLILQRESSELELPGHRNRLLWADGLAGSTPDAAVEAELGFLLGFGFCGGDHFDGGGGAIAAA